MAPSFAQNGGGAFEIARSTRDNFYRNACVSVESKQYYLGSYYTQGGGRSSYEFCGKISDCLILTSIFFFSFY